MRTTTVSMSKRTIAVAFVALMIGPSALASHTGSTVPDVPILPHARPSDQCITVAVPQRVAAATNVAIQEALRQQTQPGNTTGLTTYFALKDENVPALCSTGGPLTQWSALVRDLDRILDSFRNATIEAQRQADARAEHSLPGGSKEQCAILQSRAPTLACDLTRPETVILDDRFDGRRKGGFGEWTVVTEKGEEPQFRPLVNRDFNGTYTTWRFGDNEGYARGAHQWLVSPELDLTVLATNDQAAFLLAKRNIAHHAMYYSCNQLGSGPPTNNAPLHQFCGDPDTFQGAFFGSSTAPGNILVEAYQRAVDNALINLPVFQAGATLTFQYRVNMWDGADGVRVWLYEGQEPPDRLTLFDREKLKPVTSRRDQCGPFEEVDYAPQICDQVAPQVCGAKICAQPRRGAMPVGQNENIPAPGQSTPADNVNPDDNTELDDATRPAEAFQDAARFARTDKTEALTGDSKGYRTVTLNLTQHLGTRVWLLFEVGTKRDEKRGGDFFDDPVKFPTNHSYGFELRMVRAVGEGHYRFVRAKDVGADLHHVPDVNPFAADPLDEAMYARTVLPPGNEPVRIRLQNAGQYTENGTLVVTFQKSPHGAAMSARDAQEKNVFPNGIKVEVPIVNLTPAQRRSVEVPWPMALNESDLWRVSAELKVDTVKPRIEANTTVLLDPSNLAVRTPNMAAPGDAAGVNADTVPRSVASVLVRAYTRHELTPISPSRLAGDSKVQDVAPLQVCSEIDDEGKCQFSYAAERGQPRILYLAVRNDGSVVEDGKATLTLRKDGVDMGDSIVGEAVIDLPQMVPGEDRLVQWRIVPTEPGIYDAIASLSIDGVDAPQPSVHRAVYVQRTTGTLCFDDLDERRTCAPAFSSQRPDELAGVNFTASAVDPDGSVWAVSQSALMRRSADGTWRVMVNLTNASLVTTLRTTPNASFGWGQITDMAITPNGTIHLVGANATVLTYSPASGQLSYKPVQQVADERDHLTAAIWHNGTLWAAGSKGRIYFLNETYMQRVPLERHVTQTTMQVHGLGFADLAVHDGKLFVAGEEGWVYQRDARAWRNQTSAETHTQAWTPIRSAETSGAQRDILRLHAHGGELYAFGTTGLALRYALVLSGVGSTTKVPAFIPTSAPLTMGASSIGLAFTTHTGALYVVDDQGRFATCGSCGADPTWTYPAVPVPTVIDGKIARPSKLASAVVLDEVTYVLGEDGIILSFADRNAYDNRGDWQTVPSLAPVGEVIQTQFIHGDAIQASSSTSNGIRGTLSEADFRRSQDASEYRISLKHHVMRAGPGMNLSLRVYAADEYKSLSLSSQNVHVCPVDTAQEGQVTNRTCGLVLVGHWKWMQPTPVDGWVQETFITGKWLEGRINGMQGDPRLGAIEFFKEGAAQWAIDTVVVEGKIGDRWVELLKWDDVDDSQGKWRILIPSIFWDDEVSARLGQTDADLDDDLEAQRQPPTEVRAAEQYFAAGGQPIRIDVTTGNIVYIDPQQALDGCYISMPYPTTVGQTGPFGRETWETALKTVRRDRVCDAEGVNSFDAGWNGHTWEMSASPFDIETESAWHLSLDAADRAVFVANDEVYGSDPGGSAPRLRNGWNTRLVSPVIDLSSAYDPAFSFRHTYAFRTMILTGSAPVFGIGDGGFVEVQYEMTYEECAALRIYPRNPDGSEGTCWSKFYKVAPEGGYTNRSEALNMVNPSALQRGTGDKYASNDVIGMPTSYTSLPASSPVLDRDGATFWGRSTWPNEQRVIEGPRFVDSAEYDDVFVRLNAANRCRADDEACKAKGEKLPINVTGRNIRIGFHLVTHTTDVRTTLTGRMPPGEYAYSDSDAYDHRSSSQARYPTSYPGEGWYVTDLKVLGAAQLGLDLRVSNLTFRTGYDVSRIGVGPATSVPVNVTVTNRGVFDAPGYTGELEIRRVTDAIAKRSVVVERIPLPQQPSLDSGKSVNHTFFWSIPSQEGAEYFLTFAAVPMGIDEDEDPNDNVARIGSVTRPVVARTHREFKVDFVVTPADATIDITRFVPIYLNNTGNVPLEPFVVERSLHLTRGRLGQSVTIDTRCDPSFDPAFKAAYDAAIAQGHTEANARLAGANAIANGDDTVLHIVCWRTTSAVPPGTIVPLAAVSTEVIPSIDLFWKAVERANYQFRVEARTGSLSSSADRLVSAFATYLFDDVETGPRGENVRALCDETNDAPWCFGEGWGIAQPGFLTATSYSFCSRPDDAPGICSGRYPAGVDASAVSPVIDISAARSAKLAFFHRYTFEPRFDGGVVEASADGGRTWTTLTPIKDLLNDLPDGYDTKLPLSAASPLHASGDPEKPVHGFTGDSCLLPTQVDCWVLSQFDLTGFPGVTEADVVYEKYDSAMLGSMSGGNGTRKLTQTTLAAGAILTTLDSTAKRAAQAFRTEGQPMPVLETVRVSFGSLVGSPGPIQLAVHAANAAGQPTGPALASRTFTTGHLAPAGGVTNALTWRSVGLALAATTTYAVVVSPASGAHDASNAWRVLGSTVDASAARESFESVNGGAAWTAVTKQWHHRFEWRHAPADFTTLRSEQAWLVGEADDHRYWAYENLSEGHVLPRDRAGFSVPQRDPIDLAPDADGTFWWSGSALLEDDDRSPDKPALITIPIDLTNVASGRVVAIDWWEWVERFGGNGLLHDHYTEGSIESVKPFYKDLRFAYSWHPSSYPPQAWRWNITTPTVIEREDKWMHLRTVIPPEWYDEPHEKHLNVSFLYVPHTTTPRTDPPTARVTKLLTNYENDRGWAIDEFHVTSYEVRNGQIFTPTLVMDEGQAWAARKVEECYGLSDSDRTLPNKIPCFWQEAVFIPGAPTTDKVQILFPEVHEPETVPEAERLGNTWALARAIPGVPGASWQVVKVADERGALQTDTREFDNHAWYSGDPACTPWRTSGGAPVSGYRETCLRPDAETRLISPAFDLSRIAGSTATLNFSHRYAFAQTFSQGVYKHPLSSGGVVEIQVLDRQTGQWGPWEQLYTVEPSKIDICNVQSTLLLNRPDCRGGYSAYTVNETETGDGRFLRNDPNFDAVRIVDPSRNLDKDIQFLYSGRSSDVAGCGRNLPTQTPAGTNAWCPAEFPLTDYLGRVVRFGFHVDMNGESWGGNGRGTPASDASCSSKALLCDPDRDAPWSKDLMKTDGTPGATSTRNQGGWWVKDISIQGDVLKGLPLQIRFRAATDGNVQDGLWQVDDIGVYGSRYSKNLGLFVNQERNGVVAKGETAVPLTIRNLGASVARNLAVEFRLLDTSQSLTLTGVSPNGVENLSNNEGIRLSGYNLAPGQSANVTLIVKAGAGASTGDVVIIATMKEYVTGEYTGYVAISENEVAGFLSRRIPLRVESQGNVNFVALSTSPARPVPGEPVDVRVTTYNPGYAPVGLNLTCSASLITDTGRVDHSRGNLAEDPKIHGTYACETVTPPKTLVAGEWHNITYRVTPAASGFLRFEIKGNRIDGINDAPFAVQYATAAVGRSAVVFAEEFDNATEFRTTWKRYQGMSAGVGSTTHDGYVYGRGHRGPGSLYMGINETSAPKSAQANGMTTAYGCFPVNCTIVTPPIDLHNFTQDEIFLTLWHMDRLAYGDGWNVKLQVLRDETRPTQDGSWTAWTDPCILTPVGGYDGFARSSPPGDQNNPPSDMNSITGGATEAPAFTSPYAQPGVPIWEETWSLAQFPLKGVVCNHAGTAWTALGHTVRFRFELGVGDVDPMNDAQPQDDLRRGQGQGVYIDDISVGPMALRIRPAEQKAILLDNTTKSFNVLVQNLASYTDLVRVRLDEGNSSTPRGSLAVPAGAIELAPGETRKVPIAVTLPRDPSLLPTEFAARLFVESEFDRNAVGSTNLVVQFAPRPWAELDLSVEAPKKAVQEGTSVFIPLLVENNGLVPNVKSKVRVIDSFPGRPDVDLTALLPIDLPSMSSFFSDPADATRVIEFQYRPAKGELGTHRLTFIADPDEVGEEYTRENNVVTIDVQVIQLLIPDLDVSDPSALRIRNAVGALVAPEIDGDVVRYEVQGGELVTFELRVRNKGLAGATDVDVIPALGTLNLPPKKVPYIAPGSEIALTFNWLAQKEGSPYDTRFTVRINCNAASASCEQDELDLENNEHPGRGVTILTVKGFDVTIAIGDVLGLVEPGAIIEVPFTLTNGGAAGEDIVLVGAASGLPVTLSRDALYLRGSETVPGIATVVVPADAAAGEQFISLAAVARQNPLRKAEARTTIAVEASHGGKILPVEIEVSPPAFGLPIRLENLGNSREPWLVNVELPPGWTTKETRPMHVPVQPFSEVEVMLAITAPAGTAPGPRDVVVTATLPDGSARRATSVVTVRELRTVTVTTDAVAPPMPVMGALAYPITIENVGNSDRPFDVVLTKVPDGAKAKLVPASFKLPPGGKTAATLLVTPDAAFAGATADIRTYALFEGVHPDSPEGIANAQGVLVRVARPDIRVGEPQVAPRSGVEPGDRVSVSVTVTNAGSTIVSDLPVHLFADDVFITEARIKLLGPGEKRDVVLNWTAVPGPHTLTVQVDPYKDLVESDRQDNAASALASVEGELPGAGLAAGSAPVPGPTLMLVLAGALVALAAGGRRRLAK